jgi:hypothetical protein
MRHFSKIIGLAGAAVLAFGLGGPAQAATMTLIDENSTVQIDDSGATGMFLWEVDDIDQLVEQWFWYRIGDADLLNPELKVGTTNLTLDFTNTVDLDGDGVDEIGILRYSGDGFEIELRFALLGGVDGDGSSDLSEQIKITNTGDEPLDFHFFQYADFNLGDTATDDGVFMEAANKVVQSEAGVTLSEVSSVRTPDAYELAFTTSTLDKLNNADGDNLTSTPAIGVSIGPGDVTWAMQWDFVVAVESSVLWSKDKSLRPSLIPEPGTLALFGFGLIGLAFLGRRYRYRAKTA